MEHSMNEIRLLQEDCTQLNELNITYNDNVEVLPYVGIMFQFRTKNQPIDIRTLELDIRFKGLTDHSIEVYTLKGSFGFLVNKPQAWDVVAATEIVPNPSGVGAIIPVNDFRTVSMEAEELRSFYVTMKGPWLDYTVDAMQQTTDIALSNDHVDVYVGAGLTEYKFPEQVDSMVSPKFAGVLHYETKVNCQPSWKTTTIGYQFIVDQQSISTDIASNILGGIEYVLEEQLNNDKLLSRYKNMYALRKKEAARGDPAEYNVDCPPGWAACPSLLGSIAFEHAETLDSGDLLHQLYKFTTHITDTIDDSMSSTRVAYVGFDDAAADFRFTVNGVPAGQEMDIVQQLYFSASVRDYFNNVVPLWNTKILAVRLDEQILEETRRGLRMGRRTQSDGSINLIGRINGAQLAYLSDDDFATNLQTALDQSQYKLVSNLTFGILRPSDVADEAKAGFFRGIESVFGQIKAVYPTLPPTTAPSEIKEDNPGGGDTGGGKGKDWKGDVNNAIDTANGVDSFVWIAVGAAVGGLALIVIVCLVGRRWMRNAQDKKTRKARRARESSRQYSAFLNTSDHTPPTDTNQRRSSADSSPSSLPKSEASLIDETRQAPSLGLFMETQSKPVIDPISGSRSVQPSRMVDRSAMTKNVKEFEDLGNVSQVNENAPNRRGMPSRTATKSFDDAEPKHTTPAWDTIQSFSDGVHPDKAPAHPENPTHSSQGVDGGRQTPSLAAFMGSQPKAQVDPLSGSRSFHPSRAIDRSGKLKYVREAEDIHPSLPKRPSIGASSSISLSKKDDERSQDNPSLGGFMDRQPKQKVDPLSGSRSFHPSRSVDRIGKLKPAKEAEDIRGSSRRGPPQRTRSDDGNMYSPRRPPPRSHSDDGTGPYRARKQSSDNPSLGNFMDRQPKPEVDPLSGSRSFHPSRSVDRSGMLKPVREAEDIHHSLPRRPSLGDASGTLGKFMHGQPKSKVDPLSDSKSFHPTRTIDRSAKLKPVKEAEDIRGSSQRGPPRRTRSDDGAGYAPRRPPRRSDSNDGSTSAQRRPPRRSRSDDGSGYTSKRPANPKKPPQRARSDDGIKSIPRKPPQRARSDDGSSHGPRSHSSSLSSFMKGQPRNGADPLSGARSVQSMHHRRPQTQQAKSKPVKEYEDIQRKAPATSRSFDSSMSLYSAEGKDRPKRRLPRPSQSDDGLNGYDGHGNTR